MRWAISQNFTANVHGTRRSIAIAPGTRVDLDEVIGDCAGKPVTLAEALGPYAPHLVDETPVAAPPVRGPKRSAAPVTEGDDRHGLA